MTGKPSNVLTVRSEFSIGLLGFEGPWVWAVSRVPRSEFSTAMTDIIH